MRIGIMQPYFFPYLAYWQLINAVDKYIVYDDVAYIKGGWINRNRFLLDNEAKIITLPLENSSSFRSINEIRIIQNNKIKEKILRTLTAAYQKATFFDVIMPMLEELILKCEWISELNYQSILLIKEYLEIDTDIILSSSISKQNNLKGQDKVLHICRLFDADSYINAINGRKLYSERCFKENHINLLFLNMNKYEYCQFGNRFVPDLSIVDVLMFCDKKEVKKLLEEYSLITA